mgnify:CR=1 FL=1
MRAWVPEGRIGAVAFGKTAVQACRDATSTAAWIGDAELADRPVAGDARGLSLCESLQFDSR